MNVKLTGEDLKIITIDNVETYCIDQGKIFGDDVISEHEKFDSYLYGKFYQHFDVRKLDVDKEVIVKNFVIKQIISRDLLPKAFDIIGEKLFDEDFMMYLCEDDMFMDNKRDVRTLIDEVDTYQEGMDYYFAVKSVLNKNFDERFYKLVLEKKYYGMNF